MVLLPIVSTKPVVISLLFYLSRLVGGQSRTIAVVSVPWWVRTW